MANKAGTIYFGHITSFGKSGYNSSGAIPAVDLAVEHINNNTSILPGYKLMSTPVMDSGCNHVQSLDAFFSSVVYTSDSINIIALLGCGCSVATEPVADISHRWNITQISYVSGSSALSNRARFKNYFRTYPSFQKIAHSMVSVLRKYNWKRILFLTQTENPFAAMSSDLKKQIITEQAGIEVHEKTFPSSVTNFSSYNDLFGTSADFRIFFLNMFEQWSNQVLCEAALRNLTYPRYTWITFGWYSDEWWKNDIFNGSNGCSPDDKQKVLDRSIIIQHQPVVQNLSLLTISGFNESQYLEMYKQKRTQGSYTNTFAHTFAYDAVWALALALNKTDEQLKSNTLIPECQGIAGYTNITLDLFKYNNAKVACILKSNLDATNFIGVSGSVYFDANGTRDIHKISVLQYRQDGSDLTKSCIGYIDLNQNSTYPFYDDCNETSVTAFPSGIPPDGTPLNVTSVNDFSMAIMYYVLASAGIILVFVCAVFNIGCRKRKIVKLTSPNLNYFILVGALFLYTAMYANIVLSTSASLGIVQCHFRTWLVFLGYALVLGTVIAKLWRVYHIFHNPSTAKKPIHDWHLIILVLTLSGIQTMLLFLGSAVPLLQPDIGQLPNSENHILPKDPKSGLKVYYYINTCYNTDTPSYYWLILLTTYTAFLQCLGMILAFQTRKVKITSLNDSKHIAAIIYISSITLIALVFTHFGFIDYINITCGILNGVIFVNTTAYLGLIFLPKMINLYKDPQGNKIFEKSSASIKDSADKKQAMSSSVHNQEPPEAINDAHVQCVEE